MLLLKLVNNVSQFFSVNGEARLVLVLVAVLLVAVVVHFVRKHYPTATQRYQGGAEA